MYDQAYMYNQQQHQQQPPPPPHQQHSQPNSSQHYGGYGQQLSTNAFQLNAWQAIQFSSEDELQAIFHQHACKSPLNAIQGEELCAILNNSQKIRSYYGINWSLELCKIMIAMLDRSKDGLMQYGEFRELLQCLVYWYQTFCQFDANRSGFIEASELSVIIRTKYQYRLSVKALETVLKRYSKLMPDGRCLIAFDDFVSLSVRLRAYTEAFRARDKMAHSGAETGSTAFSYDDFLQCVMCL